MNNDQKVISKSIEDLVNDGLTVEEICDLLGISDVELNIYNDNNINIDHLY
jgi:hypothetical protein